MSMDDNPFKVPEARVADPGASISGRFLPEGRKVAAGNGWTWVVRGWELFKESPGIWALMTLILLFFFLFSCLCFPSMAALPVFMAGMMIGCKAVEEGDELKIDHLFAGFSDHVGNLFIVGLIYMAGFFILSMLRLALNLVIYALPGVDGDAFFGATLVSLLGALFFMLLSIPLLMAVWYAPPLVVFHDVAPIEAMKTSLMISVKNFLPFLVYGLVISVFSFVALLPCGLGFFIFYPVMMASTYASYRDMFIQD